MKVMKILKIIMIMPLKNEETVIINKKKNRKVYDECYNDDNDDVCDESKVKQE
jgi:hypothetical protein